MSRTGLFSNAAIGALLLVPALTLQGRAPASLEEALEATLRALESLAAIEQRLARHEGAAVGALLASTEPAREEPPEQERTLIALREEVSGLERELDELHAQAAGAALAGIQAQGAEAGLAGAAGIAPTSGLDDATRRLLAGPGAGEVEPASRLQPADLPGAGPSPVKSFEAPGYTADALRLARACYRQGRWQEALALLEDRDGSPAETYWRARCLEKLDRNEEAAAAYERLVADPAGGWEAARAREDLEFLRWRLDFLARRAAAKAPSEEPR